MYMYNDCIVTIHVWLVGLLEFVDSVGKLLHSLLKGLHSHARKLRLLPQCAPLSKCLEGAVVNVSVVGPPPGCEGFSVGPSGQGKHIAALFMYTLPCV